MTFKELAEQTLKEFPNGIWVHFNNDDPESDSSEHYLDGNFMVEFSYFLNKKVEGYYFDDESYEILEVFLKE